jgi:Leucine-rich repeat (LRR) protein
MKTAKGTAGIPSVVHFDISRNEIISLPSGIGRLRLLKTLNFAHNKVSPARLYSSA